MLGWRLFVRALTLLIDNIGVALRISALPYALVVVASLWVVSSFGVEAMMGGPVGTDDPTALSPTMPETTLVATGFLLSALSVVVTLWIAVGWHRFVLLGEAPRGILPAFHGGRVLAYLGWSLLIGLMVALGLFAIIAVLGVVLAALGLGAAGVILGPVALFAAMVLFYRLSVKLPAVAVGRDLTFAQAWDATKGHSGTVVLLAFLTVAFSLVIQIPTMLDMGAGSGTTAVTMVYQLVVQWVATLLGVGTLTALYGHLVEGRPV